MRYGIPIVIQGLWLLAACNGSRPDFAPSEIEQYCAIANNPELVSWVGDVVTLCEQSEIDHHGSCSVARVRNGELHPVSLPEDVTIQLALPASGGRLVLLLEDQRLVLANGQGVVEREIDRWASDPSISPDGERLAWIGLPDGFDLTQADLGTPKVVAVQSLGEAARTIVVEDMMASAPRPIPGTRDVLYVSGNEMGVAGFFIAGPDRGAIQITNIGLVEDNEENDPVAGNAGLWAPDGSFFYSVTGLETVEEPIDDPEADPPPLDDEENGELVDEVELEIAQLFRLALTDDVARVAEVGEGAWPHMNTEGAVLSALPAGSSPCATTYTQEGTP